MNRSRSSVVALMILGASGALAQSGEPDRDAQAATYYRRAQAWARNGEYDKAIADCTRALELNPACAEAYCIQGGVRYDKGEYEKAIADCTRAIDLKPKLAVDLAAVYNNRGLCWNRKREYDRAIPDFNQALILDPNNALFFENRGWAWDGKGEYDSAIADYNQALHLEPDRIVSYANRGFVWNEKGDYDKAIADFDQVLRINSNCHQAYKHRGVAWCGKGKYDKANEDFIRALQLDRNYSAGYYRLAWMQATCPDERYRDGKKAVENAERAYRLNRGDWAEIEVLTSAEVLAAAYAEDGQFDKAVEWQTKATDFAAKDKYVKEKAREDLASRLQRYSEGRPYRQNGKTQ